MKEVITNLWCDKCLDPVAGPSTRIPAVATYTLSGRGEFRDLDLCQEHLDEFQSIWVVKGLIREDSAPVLIPPPRRPITTINGPENPV